MIKVDMTSTDVDKQIELLKFYPEIMEKYFRPALVTGSKALKGLIRPNIPVDKGKALAAFRSSVTGKGVALTGRVGFGGGKNAPWYINVVEHGSRAHPINKDASTRSRAARERFNAAEKLGYHSDDTGGTHILVKGHWKTKVVVRGMSKRGFMAAGYAAMKPIIDAEMAQASESVVKELEVP